MLIIVIKWQQRYEKCLHLFYHIYLYSSHGFYARKVRFAGISFVADRVPNKTIFIHIANLFDHILIIAQICWYFNYLLLFEFYLVNHLKIAIVYCNFNESTFIIKLAYMLLFPFNFPWNEVGLFNRIIFTPKSKIYKFLKILNLE